MDVLMHWGSVMKYICTQNMLVNCKYVLVLLHKVLQLCVSTPPPLANIGLHLSHSCGFLFSCQIWPDLVLKAIFRTRIKLSFFLKKRNCSRSCLDWLKHGQTYEVLTKWDALLLKNQLTNQQCMKWTHPWRCYHVLTQQQLHFTLCVHLLGNWSLVSVLWLLLSDYNFLLLLSGRSAGPPSGLHLTLLRPIPLTRGCSIPQKNSL